MPAVSCKVHDPNAQGAIQYIQSSMTNASDAAVEVDCEMPTFQSDDAKTITNFGMTAIDRSAAESVSCRVMFAGDFVSSEAGQFADTTLERSLPLVTSGASTSVQSVNRAIASSEVTFTGNIHRNAFLRCRLPAREAIGANSSLLAYRWTRHPDANQDQRIHRYVAMNCMPRFASDAAAFDWSTKEFLFSGEADRFSFIGGWENLSPTTSLWAACPMVRDFTTSDVDAIRVSLRDPTSTAGVSCRASFIRSPSASLPGSQYFSAAVTSSNAYIGGLNLTIPAASIPPQADDDAVFVECLLTPKAAIPVHPAANTTARDWDTSAILLFQIDE